MSTRIADRFAACAAEGRPALATFVMAGDPDLESSAEILAALPAAGADLVELGMPFSDPMADGPAIQQAGRRALMAGTTLSKTLDLVRGFRARDQATPVILMGYYNPIYARGSRAFVDEALTAGVDGLIVVDLPAEEDEELCLPALEAGLNFIRLTTPTTDDRRLATVLRNTSGFVYYVSMTGITGAAIRSREAVREAVKRIKAHTDLPVAVGFGIKAPEDAAQIGREADGIVVGTVLVEAITGSLREGKPTAETIPAVTRLVAGLADGVRRARG